MRRWPGDLVLTSGGGEYCPESVSSHLKVVKVGGVADVLPLGTVQVNVGKVKVRLLGLLAEAARKEVLHRARTTAALLISGYSSTALILLLLIIIEPLLPVAHLVAVSLAVELGKDLIGEVLDAGGECNAARRRWLQVVVAGGVGRRGHGQRVGVAVQRLANGLLAAHHLLLLLLLLVAVHGNESSLAALSTSVVRVLRSSSGGGGVEAAPGIGSSSSTVVLATAFFCDVDLRLPLVVVIDKAAAAATSAAGVLVVVRGNTAVVADNGRGGAIAIASAAAGDAQGEALSGPGRRAVQREASTANGGVRLQREQPSFLLGLDHAEEVAHGGHAIATPPPSPS
ncbi:hypothetical protein TYRP_013752 [Tyrophagus putrescentiae]|nr:hypothetical protein TYRP_013752 [Tyrophagus putrescentiae]